MKFPKLTPAQLVGIVTVVSGAIVALINLLGGNVPVVPGV